MTRTLIFTTKSAAKLANILVSEIATQPLSITLLTTAPIPASSQLSTLIQLVSVLPPPGVSMTSAPTHMYTQL